ncbi:MAG TPA: hypothetical protein VEG38_13000 [Acidimicrobiia bacterium]|nr:hypothetical protein [Acidimicrobiia bacterium]
MIVAAIAGLAVTALRIADRGGADRAAQDDEGPAIVLSADGIGAFPFGAQPDPVIAGLTLRWGPPDGDTGWVPAGSSPFGACPGTVVRAVNWKGLTVAFSDGGTPWGAAGQHHLFRWEYRVDDPPPGPEVGIDPATVQTAATPLAGGGSCGR